MLQVKKFKFTASLFRPYYHSRKGVAVFFFEGGELLQAPEFRCKTPTQPLKIIVI